MKPFSLSFHRLLLLTTMLVAPSMAWAQQDPPPSAEQTAEDPQAEPFADESGDDGEIVVLGRFIPEPMQNTSEVIQVLTGADLARQGDDTAAAALTRLTGLSVVSSRFVFVRGLGDRYSSALLNGSPLPSPEPLRRTVPLDLFPSNILDGATVQKTYSPNYPGEFGGGVIDLRTLRLPSASFASVKMGTGYNDASTGRDGLIYHGGGDSDWTGFDDGVRDLPAPVAEVLASGQRLSELDDDTLEALGESFVNSPLTVVQSTEVRPEFEAEVSGGASIDSGIFNIGLVGVAGYDSSWRTERALRQFGFGNTLDTDQRQTTTAWDITSNALGSVSLGWNENEISLTGFYVHSTTKEAQFAQGFEFDAQSAKDQQTFIEGTGWYERELASIQLAGEHIWGPLALDWRGALAESTRDAPYERFVKRQLGQDDVFRYITPNQNGTSFTELTDGIASAGVDAAYTVALSEQREAVFSAGYAYSHTVRDYQRVGFLFGTSSPLPDDVSAARVDFLFGPDNIDPARFVLLDDTGPDDFYKGSLLVNAGYLAADVELMPLLRAAVGARYEEGRQRVDTFSRLSAGTPGVEASIENEYWLPAATLTWNFAEDLQLRLGYSQTIARPQFRELAVSQYIDPDSDRTYQGNPRLLDSELKNYDARLEYYFGTSQFFTGGVFYKEVEHPIEEAQFQPTTGSQVTGFYNAPSATLFGAEVEYRTRFDIPDANLWFANGEFLFSVNYTYTESEVEAPEGVTAFSPVNIGAEFEPFESGVDGEQLQGTPEHILNVQLGFEDDATQLTLLVGWVSERILQRGLQSSGDPNPSSIFEHPGVNVDLVYRRDFVIGGKELTFGLSARNLMGESHVEYLTTEDLGRLEFNTFHRGATVSASLSARF